MELSHLRTLLAGLLISGQAHPQEKLDADSTLLGQCEFAYTYAAQVLQMRNNEGAAKNLLFRASLMTAANFMRNARGEVVPGWVVRETTLLRQPLRDKFEANPQAELARFLQVCDVRAIPIADKARVSGKTLWGKSFGELQAEFLEKMKRALGL